MPTEHSPVFLLILEAVAHINVAVHTDRRRQILKDILPEFPDLVDDLMVLCYEVKACN